MLRPFPHVMCLLTLLAAYRLLQGSGAPPAGVFLYPSIVGDGATHTDKRTGEYNYIYYSWPWDPTTSPLRLMMVSLVWDCWTRKRL